MKKYIFKDYIPPASAEQNIIGADYVRFMERCFQFSTSVSFRRHPTIDTNPNLTDYQRPITDAIVELYRELGEMGVYTHDGILPFKISHYELVPEVREYILTASNSVWDWICNFEHANPEDIAFYRADGTVFMYSSTHNGECILVPREDETVADILATGQWNLV